MSLNKLQGVVIKTLNLGESDKIITIFSDKLGKIDVVAHGARKSKSRLMASTQPFCYCEFILYRGKSLYTLSQSSIIESFQGILMDLDKLSYGSYFLELIDNLNEKDVRNVSMLALLLKTLYIMIHDDIDLKLLKTAVSFKAVSLAGYMPQVNLCLSCKSSVEDNGYFSIVDGGIICSLCTSGSRGYKLDKKNIYLLQLLRSIKLENLKDIKYDRETLKYVGDIVSDYIRYHTGRAFQSTDFLNKLNI